MNISEYLPKISLKNFNIYSAASLLLIIGGLGHYFYWVNRYEIWYDIGIYSITAFLVLAGVVGLIVTLMDSKE